VIHVEDTRAAPRYLRSMPLAFWVVIVVGWAVNLACTVHMWTRAPGGAGNKLLFTVAQVVPLLGGLVYGGLYQPPAPQEPSTATHVPRGSDIYRH
jgi:hypothetical protein